MSNPTLAGIPEHTEDTGSVGTLPTLEQVTGETGEPAATETRTEAPKGKRRYTRRARIGKGAESDAVEPQDAPGPTPEELGALADAFALSFDYGARYMASKRGNHWLIPPDETQMLGQAWAAAVAPYMQTFAKYTPILAALVVTTGVVGPRLAVDAELAEEEIKRQQSRAAAQEAEENTRGKRATTKP